MSVSMNIIKNDVLNLIAFDDNGIKTTLQITSDMTAQQIMEGLATIMEAGFLLKTDAQ